MTHAGSVFPSRLAELRHWLEHESSATDRKFKESLASLADERGRQTTENLRRYDVRCRERRTVHDRDWETLANRWFSGYDAIHDAWSNIAAQCERLFPDWES